jgi:hypothetical protein
VQHERTPVTAEIRSCCIQEKYGVIVLHFQKLLVRLLSSIRAVMNAQLPTGGTTTSHVHYKQHVPRGMQYPKVGRALILDVSYVARVLLYRARFIVL